MERTADGTSHRRSSGHTRRRPSPLAPTVLWVRLHVGRTHACRPLEVHDIDGFPSPEGLTCRCGPGIRVRLLELADATVTVPCTAALAAAPGRGSPGPRATTRWRADDDPGDASPRQGKPPRRRPRARGGQWFAETPAPGRGSAQREGAAAPDRSTRGHGHPEDCRRRGALSDDGRRGLTRKGGAGPGALAGRDRKRRTETTSSSAVRPRMGIARPAVRRAIKGR